MDLQFISQPEAIIVRGEYPPTDVDEGRAQLAHRDAVARAIADHESNGFQYGIDISAGNVDCGYMTDGDGNGPPFVVQQPIDPDTLQPAWDGLAADQLPEGIYRATYCYYESWR